MLDCFTQLGCTVVLMHIVHSPREGRRAKSNSKNTEGLHQHIWKFNTTPSTASPLHTLNTALKQPKTKKTQSNFVKAVNRNVQHCNIGANQPRVIIILLLSPNQTVTGDMSTRLLDVQMPNNHSLATI